jgi:hypothetical protein
VDFTDTSTSEISTDTADVTDNTDTAGTPNEESTSEDSTTITSSIDDSTSVETKITYFYEKVPDVDTCFRYIRDDISPLKEFNSICHNRVSDSLYCCSPEPSPPDAYYFDDDGFEIANI